MDCRDLLLGAIYGVLTSTYMKDNEFDLQAINSKAWAQKHWRYDLTSNLEVLAIQSHGPHLCPA